jgi:phage shock protein E
MPRFPVFLISVALVLAMGIQQPIFAGGAPAGKSTATNINGDTIAASQGWVMIDQGALLIDVRSPDEHKSGHIEGSLNIPHTQVKALTDAIGPDKDRPVVLYCRSGHRAGVVQRQLEKMGYGNILNATGYEALMASRP